MKHFSDADIAEHLRGSGTRPTYVSTASTYEFAKCLSEHLEEGFLSHIVAATNLCLMADKTTDIADRAQLSIFICYTDADDDKVKKIPWACGSNWKQRCRSLIQQNMRCFKKQANRYPTNEVQWF